MTIDSYLAKRKAARLAAKAAREQAAAQLKLDQENARMFLEQRKRETDDQRLERIEIQRVKNKRLKAYHDLLELAEATGQGGKC